MSNLSPIDELLKAVWENLPVGLCLVDERGTITAVNASFAAALGYGRTELVGAALPKLFAAESAVQGLAAHEAFIAGDTTALQKNHAPILHKTLRAIFAQITDTRLELGGRVYRLISLTDLSREAQAEPQLRQLQRVENFSAMASEVGNDFNNLLSIILGYAALLQEPSVDTARIATAVTGIDKAVGRAAGLIKQTLYLSRKAEPIFQSADLGSFVADFCQMVGENFGRDLTLVYHPAPGLPQVSVDSYQLNHLLLNLTQKVRDLAGSGGRLEFQLSALTGAELGKRFSEAREPSYVLLCVRATPAPDMIETFNSAAQRMAERIRDLPILVVHNIMAVHRGWLDIAVAPSELVFSLYFPAAPEPAPLPPLTTNPVTNGAARPHVLLVVDDEETLLHSLCFILERNGYRVLKARDGIEAIDVFRQHRGGISLVLCDLGLPRMSGWEAFMKMRELTPDIDAIFMSGHLEENLQNELLKAGARGYLQKPFAIGDVLAAVNKFFATHEN
ncbi:MAG: response regulator [Verrucomicrobiota bacterium]|nr:response regulator [Verrucomicrobiota bacterium]